MLLGLPGAPGLPLSLGRWEFPGDAGGLLPPPKRLQRGLGLLSLCAAVSHPACLSAALLYKPVDRVTRSTLVLHVSHSTWAFLNQSFGFCYSKS